MQLSSSYWSNHHFYNAENSPQVRCFGVPSRYLTQKHVEHGISSDSVGLK